MKKWLVLLAALVSTFAVSAREQKVRDVDIRVTLHKNGEALIHEKWDVNTGDEITEWYLPRENLGDIVITGFQVLSDGEMLSDDGEWNVDRSRSQKAGRYGIVHKRSGVELCWGVGEYGDHLFEPVYTMSNVVKTLSDYDMLHMQFVTDELAAPPQHVRVTVGLDESLGVRLDTTNCRIWGFGFEGTAAFEDGQVVFESSEPFRYKSSVIALMRFDKGIFDSPSVQDREFQQVLDRALEGADFGPRGEDDDDDWIDGLLGLLTLAFLYIFCKKSYQKVSGKVGRREKKQVLGVNPKQVEWSRDIPFDGDLVAADYTLTRLGEDRKKNALASAEILRMIYTGHLSVSKDADGKVEIRFSDKDTGDMDSVARDLRSMMFEASGDDAVLQDTEFSKWSRKNARRLYNWTEKIRLVGANNLRDRNWMRGSRYTPDGQAQARGLLGFRKFLEDFTLTSEREAVEAHLWQEYLVFGALLGVADKVAKQLKDIDPVLFEKTVAYDFVTMQTLINMTNDLARSITNAASRGTPVSSSFGGGGGSWGGFGGGTSFGGGGGFSGGGHGGGGR